MVTETILLTLIIAAFLLRLPGIKPSTAMQVMTRSAGEMGTILSMAAQAMILYGREMGKIESMATMEMIDS